MQWVSWKPNSGLSIGLKSVSCSRSIISWSFYQPTNRSFNRVTCTWASCYAVQWYEGQGWTETEAQIDLDATKSAALVLLLRRSRASQCDRERPSVIEVPPRTREELQTTSIPSQNDDRPSVPCLFTEAVLVSTAQGWLCLAIDAQKRTGTSNRPWLSRQTGPISSGVTRNLGTNEQPNRAPPPPLLS